MITGIQIIQQLINIIHINKMNYYNKTYSHHQISVPSNHYIKLNPIFIVDDIQKNLTKYQQTVKITVKDKRYFHQRISYFLLFYILAKKSQIETQRLLNHFYQSNIINNLFKNHIIKYQTQQHLYTVIQQMSNIKILETLINQFNSFPSIDQLLLQFIYTILNFLKSHQPITTLLNLFNLPCKLQNQYCYSVQNYIIEILNDSSFKILTLRAKNIFQQEINLNMLTNILHSKSKFDSNADTYDSKTQHQPDYIKNESEPMEQSIIEKLDGFITFEKQITINKNQQIKISPMLYPQHRYQTPVKKQPYRCKNITQSQRFYENSNLKKKYQRIVTPSPKIRYIKSQQCIPNQQINKKQMIKNLSSNFIASSKNLISFPSTKLLINSTPECIKKQPIVINKTINPLILSRKTFY